MNPVTETVEQLIQVKQAEREVTRRLAWIDAQGQDNYPDGTIFRFEKLFHSNKKPYDYVMIKKADVWYISSGAATTGGRDWNELLLWLSEDNPEPTLIQLVDKTDDAAPVTVKGDAA